jgi:hypothetical protein
MQVKPCHYGHAYHPNALIIMYIIVVSPLTSVHFIGFSAHINKLLLPYFGPFVIALPY